MDSYVDTHTYVHKILIENIISKTLQKKINDINETNTNYKVECVSYRK